MYGSIEWKKCQQRADYRFKWMYIANLFERVPLLTMILICGRFGYWLDKKKYLP